MLKAYVQAYVKSDGTTQAALAAKLGCSSPSLSQKLNHERPFTLDEFARLSEAVGLGMDALYKLYQL